MRSFPCRVLHAQLFWYAKSRLPKAIQQEISEYFSDREFALATMVSGCKWTVQGKSCAAQQVLSILPCLEACAPTLCSVNRLPNWEFRVFLRIERVLHSMMESENAVHVYGQGGPKSDKYKAG